MKQLYLVLIPILWLTNIVHGDYQLLDRTFGTDGIVITNYPPNLGTINAVVPSLHVKLLPDNRILVIGDNYNHGDLANSATIRSVITLACYTNDGKLDATFGSGGIAQLPASDSYAIDCALQADGKIIVIGRMYQEASNLPNAIMIRFNLDGSIDSSFGAGGMIIEQNLPLQWSSFFKVLIQDDGNIIGLGGLGTHSKEGKQLNSQCYVVRYLPDGSRDKSFGDNGVVIHSIDPVSKQKAVQSSQIANVLFGGTVYANGTIIAVGHTFDFSVGSHDLVGTFSLHAPLCDSVIVRYRPDGSLDSSFGAHENGTVATSASALCNFFDDVITTSDNKIIALGMAQNEQTLRGEFCMVRYLSDGTPDITFGANGMVRTSLGIGHTIAKNIIQQPDGKLLVTGAVQWLDGKKFTIIRYTPDGAIDITFGPNGTGVVTLSVRGTQHSDDRSFSLALQPDGCLLVAGDFVNQFGQRDFALVRYKP